MSQLLVEEFFDMKPIKLSSDAYKDQKKLNMFLKGTETMLNKLLRACQVLTKLTASELVARPTYAEEFNNIRSNVHKAVAQNADGTFSDVASQISGRFSPRRTANKSPTKPTNIFRNEDVIEEESDDGETKRMEAYDSDRSVHTPELGSPLIKPEEPSKKTKKRRITISKLSQNSNDE